MSMTFNNRVLSVTQDALMPYIYGDLYVDGERYYREWMKSPERHETISAQNLAFLLLKNGNTKVKNIYDKRTKVGKDLARKVDLYRSNFEKRTGLKLESKTNVIMSRLLTNEPQK